MYLYNNHFCLKWKSEGVSFNQAVRELKDIFKMVDNFITEEKVNSHFKYEFIPKKIESHLTNFIVYEIETHTTDRAPPCKMTFYRLSKISGRYGRDPTPEEVTKSINDTISFAGDNCIEKSLNFFY